MIDAIGGLRYFRVGPLNILRRQRLFFLLLLLKLEVVALWLNQRHDVLIQIDIALIIHFK
jgi:hypothetical protein